jgi:hypothetical protein
MARGPVHGMVHGGPTTMAGHRAQQKLGRAAASGHGGSPEVAQLGEGCTGSPSRASLGRGR